MAPIFLAVLGLFAYLTRIPESSYDPLVFIDPILGTANGGNVFPGASLPYGMAKAGPDVPGNDNQAGFVSDNRPIRGFSHLHDSGTGGTSSMGNFPIMPIPGCDNDDIMNCPISDFNERSTDRVPGSIVAEPGYMSIGLVNNITAEMTVTNHTALYRFTFPAQPAGTNATLSPIVVLDSADLAPGPNEAHLHLNATTGRMQGNGSFAPSFGMGEYDMFFCTDFSGAAVREVGTFNGNETYRGHQNISGYYFSGGAYVQLLAPPAPHQIIVRVGLSFISEEQACSNAEREIKDFSFDRIREEAKEAWRPKFENIKLELGGVGEDLQTVFWSGIYRNLLSPQDYTGENPLWNSTEPYYDSFYCIWDSFRAQHPLLTIIDPIVQAEMVRTLLDVYRFEGKLPDCRMSFSKGYTQGGSNADVVIADAYLKNITKGINWTTAYEAVVSDAEEESMMWGEEGRGALDAWHNIHYIPYQYQTQGDGRDTHSVSRTVEYAYNDFCIAEMAKGFGYQADYDKYMERSGYWKNLYKMNQKSAMMNGTDTGFTGFLQPKYENGTWGHQDPSQCSPIVDPGGCFTYNGGATYEGPIWLYSFYVPGDMANLVETMGGPDRFVKRLDYLHDSGLLYMGDEQALLLTYLYHYAGRPALSAERAHSYIPSIFNTSINGIPGNDDSGAMGAYPAFGMMGFYPNAGQNVYLIIPPFFQSVSIRNAQTDQVATIRNVNFDPTYKNIYIQSARYNGRDYKRNWIDHGFFLNGGLLELTLGPEESDWGTRDEDLPPSLSTTGPHMFDYVS